MKIRCMECQHEENSKCLIKKTTIKLKKYRKCVEYALDSQKEIARLEAKIKVRDKEDARRKVNNAHPITGDLSRFKTTASS